MPNFYKYCLAAAVLCFLLQSLGCYRKFYESATPTINVVEPSQSPTLRRLTVDMIEYYHVTTPKLWKLRYYLENTLILQHVRHAGSSTVTASRGLILNRRINQDEIVFNNMSPGSAVQIRQSVVPFYRFPFVRLVYRISVQFERDRRYSLEFEPNFCGEYVLRKTFWCEKVNYEDRMFSSLLSGIDNYLMVDANAIDEVNHRRRIVSGIRSDR